MDHNFLINGTPTDLASLNIQPARLSMSFGDGATLTLRQEADHEVNELAPGDVITYRVGTTPRFVGRVYGMARSATSVGGDSVTYRVADELASAGSVNIELQGIGGDSVGEVIAAALDEAGYSYGSLAALAETADVGGSFIGSLAELLRLAMRREPKYRLVVNGAGQWQARKIYDAATTETLTWGGAVANQAALIGRVASMSLADSIDGCYGAVELIRPLRVVSAMFDATHELTPAWGSGLQSDWSVEDAGQAGDLGDTIDEDNLETDRSLVYRAWEVTTSAFDSARPWKLRAEIPVDPRHAFSAVRWVSIQADYVELSEKRLIVARHPVTLSGNVRVPGVARGPTRMQLVYQSSTLVGSHARVRVPETGYEGTAHTLYGVSAIRRIERESVRQVTAENAQVILDALKNVKHSGGISVYGAMPSWAWIGGVMVRVAGKTDADAPVTLDYGSVDFVQTGWDISFADELYEIGITDDRSSLVDLLL